MKKKRALAIISALVGLGAVTFSASAQSPPTDGGTGSQALNTSTEQLHAFATSATDSWLACDVLLCEPQQAIRHDRLAMHLPQFSFFDVRYGFRSDTMTGFGGGEHHPMRRPPGSP